MNVSTVKDLMIYVLILFVVVGLLWAAAAPDWLLNFVGIAGIGVGLYHLYKIRFG